MRKSIPQRSLYLLACASLLVIAACGHRSTPMDGTAEQGGPVVGALHRDGRWIVDEQGRVVTLHGVNVMAKHAPYYPASFGEADARLLADEGFTTVRLGVMWAGIEPQPSQYDNTAIEHLIALNDLLTRYGIRSCSRLSDWLSCNS